MRLALAPSITPEAAAFAMPSARRLPSRAESRGSAPRPVASAVMSAARKTVRTSVSDTTGPYPRMATGLHGYTEADSAKARMLTAPSKPTIQKSEEVQMKIRDLMTTDVVTVTPDTTLKDAAALLVERRISGLPVVDASGRVLGVLSEADILVKEGGEKRREGMLAWLFERDDVLEDKLAATTVGEAMSAPAVTVRSNAPVHKAAARMVEEGINRLRVVDDGTLLGIVTRADLVRAFTRSDEEIANEIRNEILRRTLWLEPGAVSVEVADGVVDVTGQVETETDAELLPLFIERVPGVVSVKAALTIRGVSVG
jgi:CBS domain-containing protein